MIEINTKITELFKIRYPIIQAGMVWVSGWKLASAVSSAGGLGLIGSGSMAPELLRQHIQNCSKATNKPFGVNIPLSRKDAKDLVNVAVEEGIKIVFTSAGHPKTFINILKKNGISVAHVVPSVKYALKAVEAGCDAIVGEGVEAGGHNGIDEITTFTLIPQLVDTLKQMGTRFATTVESSAHENYKIKVIEAADNSTTLAFKKIGLVRMLKNDFARKSVEAEDEGWDEKRLTELLGNKREMKGIFEGDDLEGEMEAGQSSGLIKEILPVKDLFDKLLGEIEQAFKRKNYLISS
ncbi:MAG: nitronate monooxygenase [Ignavibacteriaceae bacterium]